MPTVSPDLMWIAGDRVCRPPACNTFKRFVLNARIDADIECSDIECEAVVTHQSLVRDIVKSAD